MEEISFFLNYLKGLINLKNLAIQSLAREKEEMIIQMAQLRSENELLKRQKEELEDKKYGHDK